ncbi:MAG: hypothetical protein FWC38_10500 [Proteobacteria bacterium]|nr:hypothetical protein [Pseudomonadota bacterium]
MKCSLFHFFGGAVLALGFSFATPVFAQENVVYPDAMLKTINCGDPAGHYVLTTNVTTVGKHDKSTVVMGNTVTRNVGGVMDPSHVWGAVNCQDTEPLENNRVFITGGAVTYNVIGAIHLLDSNGNASVRNNQVTISAGEKGWVSGGYARSVGSASASNNNVTISGGSVFSIAGGIAEGDSSRGSSSTASGNTVTITGGNIQGNIYGGGAFSSGTSTASNNAVTIRGTPTFADIDIVGGVWGGYEDTSLTSIGNTLNLHTAGLAVGMIGAFQKLNFYLPSSLAASGTMLTVREAYFGNNAAISVALEGAGPSLQEGRKFNLIKASTMSGTFQPPSPCTIGSYACTVAKDGNNLVLTVGASTTIPSPPPPPTYGPTREYSGQWASANGEDAWGLSVLMSFPNNSRYIFVPWYTYDSDGNASWYIFQGDSWSVNDTITAAVRRYKGSPWGALPYNNSAVSYDEVGTATLTFMSATKAKFKYNIGGVQREIDLDRLEGAPATPGKYTGQWAKADEDAWGLSVLMTFPTNPKYIFVPWYTYDSTGKASWYIFQTDVWSGESVTATVRRYKGPAWGTHETGYDNSKISFEEVGTATLTFTSTTKAKFKYNVEGAAEREIDLVKLE